MFKNLIVFTAVLALAVLGSNAMADFADGDADVDTTLGNVGIGTAGPEYQLHITGGDIMFNQPAGKLQLWTPSNYLQLWDNQFKFVTNAVQGFTFNGGNVSIGTDLHVAGYVGIGTASPEYQLHITGGDIMFNQPAGKLQLWTPSNYLQLWDNQFKFVTNAVQGFTFNGGNVGIGTDNPQAELHVAGDIIANDVLVAGDSVATMEDLEALQAQINALKDIINDLPPGLRKIDRDGDGK